MKAKTILFAIFLGLCDSIYAQWNISPFPANRWAQTNNPILAGNDIRSVCVGDFSGFGGTPGAYFHINQFYLTQSPSYFAGEMLRTDGNSGNINAWRLFTGPTATTTTEKFALFAPATTNNIVLQSTRGDLFFRTAGPAPAFTVQERVHITQGIGNLIGAQQPNATRVNISYGSGYAPIQFPVAMLNIGFDAPQVPNGGQRTWMDVGTFICSSSDNMYVGLKNEDPTNPNLIAADNMDAVINWGDNTVFQAPGGPDNFRFIFTSFQQPATLTGAASTNGLEAMRITPFAQPGNPIIMFTGIGGDPQTNLYGPLQNSINPTQTLEVNSNGATTVAGGSSGLRFTNLNTNSPIVANPGAGVLAVNGNGDVIYVPGGGNNTLPFGGVCGNNNNMTSDFEIPMGTFNYVFSGQGAGTNVGIGMPAAGCAPTAKLDVRQNSASTTGSRAVSIQNTDPNGTGMDLNVNGAGSNHFALISTVQGGTNTNYGLVSNAFGGSITYAGSFKGIAASVQNIGVLGSAQSTVVGSTNYGGYFSGFSNWPGTTNYGIYATSNTNLPNNFAARFDGNVAFNGSVLGSQFAWTSDQNLKTNIDTLTNALGLIHQLQPKTFYYDTLNSHGLILPGKKQFGFIAQEVGIVLPELVSTTTKPADYDSVGNMTYAAYSYQTLNYNAFIAILMKGMQEQQHLMDSMQTTIADMQSQINGCCSSSARTQNPTANQTDVTLTNSESIVLDQNVPNPFAEQTTITYNLPESAKKAQLLFYDATGKLIKAVDLTTRGKGQINVFANDLSNGIYTYALVVDGQIADTKRMVKTQ